MYDGVFFLGALGAISLTAILAVCVGCKKNKLSMGGDGGTPKGSARPTARYSSHSAFDSQTPNVGGVVGATNPSWGENLIGNPSFTGDDPVVTALGRETKRRDSGGATFDTGGTAYDVANTLSGTDGTGGGGGFDYGGGGDSGGGGGGDD